MTPHDSYSFTARQLTRQLVSLLAEPSGHPAATVTPLQTLCGLASALCNTSPVGPQPAITLLEQPAIHPPLRERFLKLALENAPLANHILANASRLTILDRLTFARGCLEHNKQHHAHECVRGIAMHSLSPPDEVVALAWFRFRDTDTERAMSALSDAVDAMLVRKHPSSEPSPSTVQHALDLALQLANYRLAIRLLSSQLPALDAIPLLSRLRYHLVAHRETWQLRAALEPAHLAGPELQPLFDFCRLIAEPESHDAVRINALKLAQRAPLGQEDRLRIALNLAEVGAPDAALNLMRQIQAIDPVVDLYKAACAIRCGFLQKTPLPPFPRKEIDTLLNAFIKKSGRVFPRYSLMINYFTARLSDPETPVGSLLKHRFDVHRSSWTNEPGAELIPATRVLAGLSMARAG